MRIDSIARFSLIVFLAACCFGVFAQESEVGVGFARLSAEEQARLRAVLAEPVPEHALYLTLERHFSQKSNAAHRLNDQQAEEVVLRQWIEAIPTAWVPRARLAYILTDRGQYDEAIRFRHQAIALVSYRPSKAYEFSALSNDFLVAGRIDEAQKTVDVARQYIVETEKRSNWPDSGLRSLHQARFRMEITQSVLHERLGHWDAAIAAANESESNARSGLKVAQRLGADQRYFSSNEVTYALSRKIDALRVAGRFSAADLALRDYMRLSREIELRPMTLSTMFRVAANLRIAQREFNQAETYARRAIREVENLGFDTLHPWAVSAGRTLVIALEGQKRWPDAVAELDRLDGLASRDASLLGRVRFPFERGLAYIHTGNAAQAVDLFASVVADSLKRYGEGHFFVAEARGLQGVALWRSGMLDSKATPIPLLEDAARDHADHLFRVILIDMAIPLLKGAVRDYMSVANADYLENIGIRKETRELIFATYLEALATTPGEDATHALGPADWVRGGVVQEALADAAVRSAATDPALADIVRREQDAKNEILGLRKYLAGETGGAATPPPETAAKMRARIADLESNRQGLQSKIKAQFPDYDRLVHVVPPSVADIAKGLGTDEALLMLLPTNEAVYVWAVTSAGNAVFARADLSDAQLTALVKGTRATLDFAEMGGRITPFNADAASELYQRLLLPVQNAFQGKKLLVVAAGGALSQLPFGILLTRPTLTVGTDVPWLIKQAAITQVPSVSAWLTLKQLAKGKSAPQPLMGWGDPQFGAKTAAASSANTRNVVLTRASTVVDLENDDPRSALRYADMPPLPETRDELMAIAYTLHADPQRDLRLGEQATKASVLQSDKNGELQRKRVLVFATHGLMAGDLPNLNQPALALATTGSEAQDPLGALLTLEDVLGLKLNADWVVLSACNTAAADGKAEEALSGLARGFFYAGSRSLLVTHWAVESESAKLLTTGTFEHYAQNPQAPKAESLRQAMLKVMVMPQYTHPAYWAPYALVGDGGR
jgi:CHAT domain-containing protein